MVLKYAFVLGRVVIIAILCRTCLLRMVGQFRALFGLILVLSFFDVLLSSVSALPCGWKFRFVNGLPKTV